MRGRPSAFSNSPLGAVLELAEDLAPSATCRIEHAGTSWNVRNEGGEPITAGVRVRVTAVDGLTLGVRPVPPSEPA
jgi:membrane protein implicated in regulation of membrane protease activity